VSVISSMVSGEDRAVTGWMVAVGEVVGFVEGDVEVDGTGEVVVVVRSKFGERGLRLGLMVGVLVGLLVGVLVGVIVGVIIGAIVGVIVGMIVGVLVGVIVGVLVGVLVGVIVGWVVLMLMVGGAMVGSDVVVGDIDGWLVEVTHMT